MDPDSADAIREAALRASSSTASSISNASSSVWDRLSTWISEHKAAVYTIAGVTLVVTGAGAIYYVSGSSASAKAREEAGEQRKSKKERRKAKKEAEQVPQKDEPATPGVWKNILSSRIDTKEPSCRNQAAHCHSRNRRRPSCGRRNKCSVFVTTGS